MSQPEGCKGCCMCMHAALAASAKKYVDHTRMWYKWVDWDLYRGVGVCVPACLVACVRCMGFVGALTKLAPGPMWPWWWWLRGCLTSHEIRHVGSGCAAVLKPCRICHAVRKWGKLSVPVSMDHKDVVGMRMEAC